MPRIETRLLDSVIYLYRSMDDAQSEEGVLSGGTGFLVWVPPEAGGRRSHCYAVTNSHVAKCHPVIRLNRRDGSAQAIDLTNDAWTDHPEGDDVAACEIRVDHGYKMHGIHLDPVRNEVPRYCEVGSDVFMLSRFVQHDGRLTNMPVVRFGTIAMAPQEPIEFDGRKQLCYLVETRSISGHSGSPVFLQSINLEFENNLVGTHGQPVSRRGVPLTDPRGRYVTGSLLGINCCHIPSWSVPVCDESGKELPLKWHVTTNSGLAGVIPVWKLEELLLVPELVEARKREAAEQRSLDPGSPALD